MKLISKNRIIAHATVLTALASVLAVPGSLKACAACYGKADGPMAQAMNWGILTLLVVIVMVLAGVATFFVFLVKRSAKLSVTEAPSQLADAAVRG